MSSFILGLIGFVFLVISLLSFFPTSVRITPATTLNFGATTSGLKTRSQVIILKFQNSWTGFRSEDRWQIAKQGDWFEVNPASGRGKAWIQVTIKGKEMAPGNYRGRLVFRFPGSGRRDKIVGLNLTVYAQGNTLPPAGWIDLPTEGEKVSPHGFLVAGWALDDIEVTEVTVKREALTDEEKNRADAGGLIFLGQAAFHAGIRPDVQKLHPEKPLNYRSGWGFMVEPQHLPPVKNASFKIFVFFKDKEGHEIIGGMRRVLVDHGQNN